MKIIIKEQGGREICPDESVNRTDRVYCRLNTVYRNGVAVVKMERLHISVILDVHEN